MADEPQSQPQWRTNPPTLFPHASSQAPARSSSSSEAKNEASKPAAVQRDEQGKPYVLDKDGKPCRLCTSAAAWRNLTKQTKASSAAAASTTTATQPQETISQSTGRGTTKPECPPDVEVLGRSTWTLLHSLTATYPEKASASEQADMRSFLTLLSKLYPCWVCADDFRNWMAEPSGKNQPRLGGRKDFGNWMCEAHNEVNRKLGKKEFDCRLWEQRWKDGWKDGRCD
ncbi:flavin-linked sulfhydryl oxidase [Aspergillus mulundensis]|uniref:Sulfhydryl oxidase n=1 Tax=Aspergillus mulundensis TaxID=1810919 RepID=A0A3D8SKH1_9EURO|nr:Sulfhydryl oxidase [Aspergillus mulundensis]RDW86752.1 Sulfhydryl oxidase [Aspergillus mulundensis]